MTQRAPPGDGLADFTSRATPTAGSIVSSARARPAPRRSAASATPGRRRRAPKPPAGRRPAAPAGPAAGATARPRPRRRRPAPRRSPGTWPAPRRIETGPAERGAAPAAAVGTTPARMQHLLTEGVGDLHHVGRARRPCRHASDSATSRAFPTVRPSGSIHRGQDRPRPACPSPGRSRPARGRAPAPAPCPGHKGAAAELDVEHQGVDPLGHLLAEDAGADERDRLDRRRDVAQRVELPVGGRELRRLPDEGSADPGHLGPEFGEGESDPESRDRLELVERAARVARGRAR